MRAGYHQGMNKIGFPCKWPQIMSFLIFGKIDKLPRIREGMLLISQKKLMSVWMLPMMGTEILQGTLNFLKISLLPFQFSRSYIFLVNVLKFSWQNLWDYKFKLAYNHGVLWISKKMRDSFNTVTKKIPLSTVIENQSVMCWEDLGTSHWKIFIFI